MNNVILFLCFCCSVFSGISILLLTSYYCKLKDQVDDFKNKIDVVRSNLSSVDKYYDSKLKSFKDDFDGLSSEFDIHCSMNSMNFDLLNSKIFGKFQPFKRFRKW